MSTENLEYLLERLITVNEQILETVTDIKSEVQEINKELNWVEEHSYAKVIYDGLNAIESKLDTIDSGISNIDINTTGL
ncbi:hypothetical protein [Aliivibrio finisterrensis]|uniref:Uncharacterized protein n=1 Tax=Aliivibrio finisterrensis TaxID=511998 RepID=A0A6N6RVY7_9GAMM|nr:hypothetical protein [Aliivibrio finisterrensis]KAB2825909.1 hypothetical protein F8B77_04270 [Aliivibrio finisterrensis]